CNCGCPNCRGIREGTVAAVARSQESVAVGTDRQGWFLLNASPEIRAQIESFPPLHPRDRRHSPIQALLLTNGDLDHCLGLLSLRESHPLAVYATERVRVGFTERNVLYRTLERFPGHVTWRTLKLGREEALLGVDGSARQLAKLGALRKIYIHLNNTNPLLRDDSPERATVTTAGWEIAYDGMEITL